MVTTFLVVQRKLNSWGELFYVLSIRYVILTYLGGMKTANVH